MAKGAPAYDPKDMVDRAEVDEVEEPLRDALTAALAISDVRDREDLASISSRVRWVKSTTAPSYERFQQAKALAMMDEFSDYTCQEKKNRLSVLGMDTSKPRCLEIFRRTEYFKDTRRRVLEARDRIRSPRDLDTQIEEGAQDAAEALNLMTVHGKGKERYMAAKEFMDRAAPKTLTGPGAHSVVIGLEIGQQMVKALETLRSKGRVLDSEPQIKQIGGGSDPP